MALLKPFDGTNFDPLNPQHRPPYIKGKGFCPNPIVKFGIPREADSARDKKVIGTVAWEKFWETEIERIHNGYQTGGYWIPGCYYYYLNYAVMSTIKFGNINPDVDDLHMELAYLIHYCKGHGKNLMIPKARRKGISEATHKMVIDYGWRFMYSYKAGIASGKKDFITDFVAKLRYGWMHLPQELYVGVHLNNDDEIIAGWTQKNTHGAWEELGTMNTVYTRTIHSDASGFKGNYYNDIIVEEVGETEKFLEFWAGTRDAMSDGAGNQIGNAYVYGCVCAGTKVWDNHGNIINIEDLKPENGILGFDAEKGVVSKEFISYWQPPAEKMCYKITTNTGRYLECSEDHPILTRSRDGQKSRVSYKKGIRFKEAKDIIIGDNLATVEEVDVWSNKRMFEPRIIGWAVGDGTYGTCKKGCFNITMASADKEVYEYISSKYVTRVDYSAPTKDGRELKKFRINGVYLRDSFREMGIVGQTKENKHLPKDLHSYCKKDVCEFIGGYFDADGCIYYNERTKESFLKLTSAHYHLLDEMRFILQKIGIRCNIMYEKPNFNNPKTTRGHYNLIIKDLKSIFCFYDNIHFKIKRKQDNFKKAIKGINKAIPRKANVEKGIRFETVKSVECIGMKPIYNLTAATTHTYIANGIITHNTGGDINKGSKAFKEAWDRNKENNFIDTNNFIRFVIPAQRFYFYGGNINKSRDLPATSSLFRQYKDYQLLGVEDIDLSVKDILQTREDKKHGRRKDYLEYMQNNPINEQEIFRKSVVNNFDTVRINTRVAELEAMIHPPWTKYKLEYVKDEKGMIKQPAQVVKKALEKHEDQNICIWQSDGGDPNNAYVGRYVAGIDSYNIDTSSNSKSLGAMLVLDRITKKPVAAICCRPARKEIFFEMCIMLSIYYKMYYNVLGDVGSDTIIKHFEQAGCYKYLADRPKKFESEGSTQSHDKWVRLTDYSRPRMIGLMQSHVNDYCDQIDFPELLDQLGNYDEVAKDSDNDLADAYGIALMQDLSCEIKPRDVSENKINDRYKLPEFESDGNGGLRLRGGSGMTQRDIQEDTDLWMDLFGPRI